jgi:hypothetical protein
MPLLALFSEIAGIVVEAVSVVAFGMLVLLRVGVEPGFGTFA